MAPENPFYNCPCKCKLYLQLDCDCEKIALQASNVLCKASKSYWRALIDPLDRLVKHI